MCIRDSTCAEDIEDLGRFIPPVTNETLKEAKDMVKAKQGECNTIKDIGSCTDFTGLIKDMCNFKKSFNEKKAAMDTQVKTATSVKNILCRGQTGCEMAAKPAKGCMV